MTTEIKNLIIQTQIDMENVGKELLNSISKISVHYSKLYEFFLREVYVEITNITRQYLQVVDPEEKDLSQRLKEEIKNKLLRCSIKAWEQLAEIKRVRVENSIKYKLFSKFKKEFKNKVFDVKGITNELENINLNLSMEERIEKLKKIVEIYNSLHASEWFKNPLLTASIIGLIVGVVGILIALMQKSK
ncbi:MAG: hypothetical protein Q8R04_00300 [Nanoarchaeota archaeon]|nr:hypothetical protein [Nanoarchaeota archaeon]